MKNDFDWQRFADIPDPLGAAAGARTELAPKMPPRPTGTSPTRARVRALRMAALGTAIAYEVVGIAVLQMRPDVASTPPWQLALGLLIPAAGALATLRAATREGDRGLGMPVGRLAALTLGAPLLFAGITLLALPHREDDAFWVHAGSCFLTSAKLGIGPLLLGAWAMRYAFVVAARWRAAALGVASGAFAAATMSLVCPNESALHLVIGHGTIMLVMGLLGALVGRRVAGT